MTWLGLKLFLGGMLKRLLEALSALFRWTLAHPWQAACIVLLSLSAVLWRHNHHTARERDTWHRAYSLQRQASDDAAKAQKAENARIQSSYRGSADNAERDHSESAPRVRTATDSFILHGGVRPAICAPGGGHSTAQASDPAVHDQVPADSVVAVASADVQRCADATAYAVSAHNLAADWIAKGLADAPAR